MSKHLTHFLVAVLVVSIGLSSITAPGSAQADTSDSIYTSETSGATLDVGDSGDGVIDQQSAFLTDYEGYTEEGVLVRYGSSRLWISFISGDVSPADWTEIAKDFSLQKFVQGRFLGWESGADHSWLLAHGSIYLDIAALQYQEFFTQMANGSHIAVVVTSPESEFIDTIHWMRANLTIDGQYLTGGPQSSEFEAMVQGTSAFEPVPMDFQYRTVEDWSDSGLVSDTEWHNPDTGVVVTWDASALQLPLHIPHLIPYSEEDASYTLLLTTPGFTGYAFVGMSAKYSDQSIEDFVNLWSSEEWLASNNNYFPVNGSKTSKMSGSVVYSFDTGYGVDGVMIREAFMNDEGLLTTVSIRTTPANMAEVYTSTMAALRIDGELVQPSWDVDEFQEMFPNRHAEANADPEVPGTCEAPDAAATTPNRTTRSSRANQSSNDTETDWSEMGLVSDTEWHSPNSDITFDWDADQWRFAAHEQDAIQIGDGYTSLKLITLDGRGELVLSSDTNGVSLNQAFNAIRSGGFTQDLAGDSKPLTLLDSYSDGTTASAIFLSSDTDGETVLIVDIYELPNGHLILSIVAAKADDIADVYRAVWDGVRSGGEYYPLTWTIEDIEALEID